MSEIDLSSSLNVQCLPLGSWVEQLGPAYGTVREDRGSYRMWSPTGGSRRALKFYTLTPLAVTSIS